MKECIGQTIGLEEVGRELAHALRRRHEGKISVKQFIDTIGEISAAIHARGEHSAKAETRATFGDARLIVSDELLEYDAEKTPDRVVVNGVEYRPTARTHFDVRTLDGDFDVPGARWAISEGVLQTYDLSGVTTGVFSVARLVCAIPKRIVE